MDYKNKPAGYYDNVRTEMLEYLPSDAKRVLDVGCGNGAFALIIKEKNNAEVWGIEYMEDQGNEAISKLDKVFVGMCEDYIDELPDDYFDVIYFNDVLEHLAYPDEVLKRIKTKLSSKGVVITSIPNMRFYGTFRRLLFSKDWKYDDHGVMDKTHLRYFTGKSIRRMFEESGYSINKHEGINKSRSLKPYLFYVLTLFTQLDMRYVQYATVASVKK